ncbi:3-phenylpropionate/trans-cinnamate dioxygenase ferredoxin reductase subunit [Actinoalloteichus hoggarensis]|uniref:NAD(P)/FAD-dependent oxidoreductase n=1 Tax=Actinoalloteichus hoggarensis TaxID=1470176 RepID=UPI0018225ABB|nr:FAD-dependent oxidoreductase [Actinoalloteichus hoggarensis]MBB5920147.1 3-phenylpropionate/trans-cinnamate dioxygenase ferredoxin reductase subunit [Actinoalloteichus hoggarensis]
MTIVGAGLAGWHAARELRAQGFDDTITVIGAEPRLPYDRPPLSKRFLRGEVDEARLALSDEAELTEVDAHWITGRHATRLDRRTRTVELDDGTAIRSDGVVIATGARATTLPGLTGVAGVHTLRTLADARALRAALTEGTPRTVVIGAGFIGAEVAATCHALGLPVTVVEAAEVPLARVLGPTVGAICGELHRDHGVTMHCGFGVAGLRTAPYRRDGAGDGTRWKAPRTEGASRVTAVLGRDGRELAADVVVVGIGSRPEVEWLAGSGLDITDGVGCDAVGATALPGVVALGDVARYADPRGGSRRHEHWTAAVEQAPVAVRTLLTGRSHGEGGTDPVPNRVPYFWSDQYSTRVQLAGCPDAADDLEVVEGSFVDRDFVAVYRRRGRLTGVVAMNRGRGFTRLRRELRTATDRAVESSPAAST